MSFIRTKEVVNEETGKTYRYHQLVENHWKDGRIQQSVVAHLGEHPTIQDAVAELRRRLRELEQSLANTAKRCIGMLWPSCRRIRRS